MVWTETFPTQADDGKWFLLRNKATQYVFFRQISARSRSNATQADRQAGTDKTVYLCPECHEGVTFTSYGTPLAWYKPGSVEFSGPIEMPTDYKPGSGVRLDMVAKSDKV